MFSSIKAKIVIFYMAVLFGILSVLGIFLYFSLDRIVYDSIDSTLLSRAKALATLVSSNRDETEFNFSDEVMWEYHSPKAKSFFQIRRLDGTTLEKSESLGDSELPFRAGENRMNFEDIRVNGAPARLTNFHFFPEGEKETLTKDKGLGLMIQCAEVIQDQRNLLKNYRIILSLSILSIMIISASGGFFIARKALTPVKEISNTIGRISESHLSERIAVQHLPKELRILASSFNLTFDSLEKAFNRQRQFAADASHELRTPLSVILSQGEIMLRKERTHAEYKDALTAITEAAGMMYEMVRKLLTLARLGADKAHFKMENIKLSEIIRESVKLLTPLADRKEIRIKVSADEQAIVRGDRTFLLELFINLIDNALKFNVPRGNVDIAIINGNNLIVTEIRDTGIGIPEKDLDKVFDRFYRADKSRSRASGGSGLGLSICGEIAKLHGGKIQIKSSPGSGTTLSVYLKGEENAAQT